jgi:stage V sporulation protein D (sporulation-specific penicillin-binding protein)
VFRGQGDISTLDLAIYAFGQNFNVTLIQQIAAVSAVANGGYLVQPHLVSSITDHEGNLVKSFDTTVRRQAVSTEVCKTVSKILEEGVSGNGGAKNAYVAGYRIAAKTGTPEKKNVGSKGRYVCSTVAYAPAENPQYAVIIIVDEPTSGVLYGSTVAAPYVGNVMETILPYLGVEAVYTEEELAKMTVKIPKCLYNTGNYAKSVCESSRYGLTVEIVGDPAGVVVKQYPEAGTVIEKSGGRIVLYTDREAEEPRVVVPDVTGMSAVAANQTLINAGLNIRIFGTKNYLSGTGATVISQSIRGGTEVARGTVVEVTFRYLGDEDYADNDY